MPAPEIRLWYRIRNKQLGVKFRRQYAVDDRILDFYCPEQKFGIEIDGESHYRNTGQHQEELSKDKELLQKHQIKIIRFLNSEIMLHIDEVIESISRHLQLQTHPHPNPPPLKYGEGE